MNNKPMGQTYAYMTMPEEEVDHGWFLDNGVTHHVTNDIGAFNIKFKFKGSEKLVIINYFQFRTLIVHLFLFLTTSL